MSFVDVVVRCRNEMPHARRTLEALFAQVGLEPRVLFLDCGSTDGSREEAERAGATVRPIVPAEYVPGAVLNLGMALTQSPLVAFINADAIPLSTDALALLLRPFDEPAIAASYGRQVPRPGADPLTRLDYQRAFGDTKVPMQHGTFFSMAASAVRREVWKALPFDERLRFSEDADWTHRATALGWRIAYVPGTRFEHSHAYDLNGQLKRRAGEGTADTAIFRLGAPSPLRELIRPLAGALARDLRAGFAGPRSTLVRTAQMLGRFSGRRASTQPGSRGAAPRAEQRDRPLSLCRDPSAEKGISEIVDHARKKIAGAIGKELRALALVGSYARGEGGAIAHPGTAALGPYNDLDLIAVVPRDAAGWRRKLRPLCKEWSAQLGIDIDVWALDESFLKQVPRTLFWLDIAQGGFRVLEGNSQALQALRMSPREVPLDEAGRLLANRAVGIALSNLEGGDEPMARHIHKAVLACGDALLLAADRYGPTLIARQAELERLRDAPAVGPGLVERYAEAGRYRERPDLWRPHEALASWYQRAREQIAGWHFAFESFRRGAPFSAAAFASWREPLYLQLPDVRLGGAAFAAVRAAALGRFPLFSAGHALRHPRERLARAAIAIAYGHNEPGTRAAGCKLLGLAASASDALVAGRLRDLAARAG